jgi:Kef-type K+ transport system membrane component KefB
VKDANGTLLLILAAALIAPVIASSFPRLKVPALVLEILLGIVIGPEVLDLVAVTPPIELLSNLGLAALIFMAGFELDPDRLRGEPTRLALTGWGISIVIGLGVAGVLHLTGLAISQMFLGFALTTTALGTLLPIARDAGLLPTPLGTHLLAVGSVGEFGPIIAIALVLSGTSPTKAVESLTVFVVVAVIVFVWARQRRETGRVHDAVAATLRSSGQVYIRLALLMVALLAWVATRLGLDFLLGAFTAGMIYRLFLASAGEIEIKTVELKLEAVAFGYVIPIFFVVTGITYDLDSLIHSARALAMVPIFLLAFLLVRGTPVLLYRSALPDPNDRRALVFFSATGLPLIVAITTLGVSAQQMRPATAAALVGAGMVSVVLFPVLGLAAYRRTPRPAAPAVDHPEAPSLDAP